MLNISGYHITEEIYANYQRVVYRGIRLCDRQPVILKCLQGEAVTPTEIARLQHEYDITHNLNLSGVVKALAFLTETAYPVLILPDFGGISLKDFIKNRRFSLREFLDIAIDLAQTLGELQQQNIIHKDIKPSNIIIKPETLEVRITDFAIASQLSRESAIVTHPNLLEGTLAYMSPEQTGRMNRSVDYRSDFYSLGVTFYEMLTRELPCYADDPMEMVHCHIARQPVAPSQCDREIPKAVSDIVMKLLAKTAEDRYKSAFGLKTDLETCLTQLQEKGKIEEFQLGKRDFSGQLQIPQKLYGREKELARLMAAFERVSSGKTEMMLVAGYSGIGKSALVQEIHKPLVRDRGYFISGKFDQLKRNIPFEPLIQAFRDLIRQLLSESSQQIAVWKQKLAEALGANGQVIIDVISEVELIVGKQPLVPELGATESQNRFNLVFQKFIGVFTQKQHPLVIFLDDLQWSDFASLKLIQRMITESDSGYLLLIGAYRDNEVDATHGLMMTLEEIQKSGTSVNTITIQPLELTHVNQLIADTLSCKAESLVETRNFASLLFHRTNGNPFFLTQLLKSLDRENLLTFDFTQGAWQWDIDLIQEVGITDNVVDLMVSQIAKLSQEMQNILKLAACIGNRFSLKIISLVNEKSLSDTGDQLWEAMRAGLILPESNVCKIPRLLSESSEMRSPVSEWEYKFLHDRVQQAAYALISDAEKQAIHWKIGQLMLKKTPSSELEEEIFDIVNQLNYGIELISQQTERDELAKLNLMAGRKAKAATAYGVAVEYLTVGMELLADSSWQMQYDLTLALYVTAIEAAYLGGDFQQMECWKDILLASAVTVLDKVKTYEVQITACVAQNKLREAIEIALSVLSQLGINFPKNPSPIDWKKGIQEVASNLAGKPVASAIDLPLMSDPIHQAALRILLSIDAAAYLSFPEILPLTICKQVNLSLIFGNSAGSAKAYANYGLILCSGLGGVETGYQFGQLALKLLEKLEAKEIYARTSFLVNFMIRHWKEPLRQTLKSLQEAHSIALETGDLTHAAIAAEKYCYHAYFAGEALDQLAKQMENYAKTMVNFKQNVALWTHEIHWQSVLNLIGKSQNPCRLTGRVCDETIILPIYEKNNAKTALYYLYFNKLFLCYLFDDYSGAIDNSNFAEQYLDGARGQFISSLFYFYDSLAQLAIYSKNLQDKQDSSLVRVSANQEKIKHWAFNAPMNYLHKYYLVEAEKHRVLNQKNEAIKFYDLAIKGAKANEYIQDEALAHELAAKFYFDWGKEKIAKVYITDAYAAYVRWGAQAKVKDLESKYPYLMAKAPTAAPKEVPTINNTTILKTSNRALSLDFTTVLKASQAIAGEIVLDNLLTKLLLIVMENAGAQSGVLLLNREGQLFVEAAGTFDPEQVVVRQSTPIEMSDLPLSLVNYVARIQEDVVLNNASREGNFTNDRYIGDRQTKSAICTPILSQGKLIGILYLENNLTTGAFTPARLDVLKLLCSQAAISLENAQLYASLEQKVEERTLQLNEKNQHLMQEIQERQQVEEALRLSEERFRAIFESTDDLIAVWDKNVHCLYANRAMLEPIKLMAEQAIGKSLAEIYQFSEACVLWSDRIKTVFKTCQSMYVEDTTNAGERTLYSEATLSPIKDATGNVFAVGIVYRDVTERKEAEIALRQSEERYRAVVEDQTELICRFLPDGTLTFVNDAHCRYFNKLREELIGYNFMPALPDEERLKLSQSLASLNSDNPIATIEHRVLFGKHERWHQWTNRAIFDEAGNFIEFQGVGRDISDRKLAEEQVRKSEEKFRTLFETLPIGITLTDENGNIIQCNPASEKLLALPISKHQKRALQSSDWEIIRPDGTPMPAQEYAAVIALKENRKVEGVQMGVKKGNNDIVWLDVIAAPIPLEGYGVQVAYTDITDRKRAEEALQKAKETADAASKAKGEFLSKMSHELRTPLNAILGFTQILDRDASLNSQQQDYVGIISRAGEHLLTLINDVLEMSKIEAGRIELNESSFDLYRLLNSLHEMLQLKSESKGLQLIFDVSSGVSQSVKTDETKLRQVLINLLGNAVKFTNKGRVTLRVRQKPEERKENAEFAYCVMPSAFCLFFEVEDTGPGIAPDELATIFDPFVQTETGRKSQSGTGLGLPISRQFVQLMGGDITVTSTVGEGTIFKFEIQISQGEGVGIQAQLQSQRAIALQPHQPVYRILVVEDKSESRLLLVKMLSPLGFEVREAVNGQEAVTIWENWQPHLIWMDMQMPIMDGYEATQLIKSTPAGRETAIIALTASAFEENRTSVLSAGCDDFVSKPFREDVILEKMAEYLGVRYIYEETAIQSKTPAFIREKSAKGELTAEAIASLPAEWIAQLHQAAMELDDEAIAELTQSIRALDAPLADALADLAKKLRFDKIVEFTQKANQ